MTQSHFEILVKRDGQHFFSTTERSAICVADVKELKRIFREKFPTSEGYDISVRYWEITGRLVANLDTFKL